MSIVLNNVRLSFPSLFETESYNGADTGKFTATFLLDKKDPQVKKLQSAIKAAAEEKFGKPIPKAVKFCLQDGDDKEYDGYAGHWSIKAGSKRRPVVVDRDKTPLTESDNRLYAGCYVNASIDLWVQDNSYGKRVNCNLNGVQFLKDGEPFGADNSAMDDFAELEAVTADEAEEEDPFA